MQATPRDPWRSKQDSMTASTCVSLPRRRLWAALACALLAACTASAEDVRPPSDKLYFPTGLAISPDEHVLFAANANSELRYDSGSISVIDLDAVQPVIAAWVSSKTIPDNCSQDPDHSETLTCDASLFIKANAGVRIGNFATDIAVQDFTGGNLRVLVPTRGDPSISWADYNGQALSCVASDEQFALCDDTHRLTTVRNDSTLGSIPNEPFSVFADSTNGFAVVTHQSAGAVTLIDSRAGADAQVVDIKAGLFAQDATTGIRSATGVAGRSPHSANDIIYVGSRSEDRIQTFTVGRFGSDTFLLASNYFFLDAVGANTGGSVDTRALQFSPSGGRMYVVNRNPPSLQIYDTTDTATGVPRNAATGASDICREASTVSVLANNQDATATVDNGGERAYVTCFQDGQIYVVDPHGQSKVEDIITVGRGPYGIVAATGVNPAANMQKQLFISNFLEDTIAVVDVTPSSKTRNRVVLRIGVPRAP